MAQFDDTLADLNGTLAAIHKVLEAHPNIAAEVRKAVESADPIAVAESQAQDEARANALAQVNAATVDRIVKRDPTPERNG